MKKNKLFKKLKEIYKKAEALFDCGEKNVCGSCDFCCKPLMIHGVNEIEYDYINENLKKIDRNKDVKFFKDYVQKKKNIHGQLIHEICPFYNKGCTIYKFRPMSCRYYGFYNPVPPPLFCPFYRWTKIYSVKDFYTIVPLTKDFVEVKNLYKIYIAENEDEKINSLYQMGYDLYFHGQIDRAEYFLKESLSINPFYWKSNFQLSHIYYGRKEIKKAIDKAEIALKESDMSEVKLHLALLYLHENRIMEAGNLMLHVTKKEPENGLALGLTGYLFYITGRKKEAYEYAKKAISIDPCINTAAMTIKLLEEELL